MHMNCHGQHRGLRGLALGCALLLAACERDPADNLLPAVSGADTQDVAAATPAASDPTAGQASQRLASGELAPGAGSAGGFFGVNAQEMLSYHGRGFVQGFEGRPYPPLPDREMVGNAASLDPTKTPFPSLNGPDQAVPLAGASRQPEGP